MSWGVIVALEVEKIQNFSHLIEFWWKSQHVVDRFLSICSAFSTTQKKPHTFSFDFNFHFSQLLILLFAPLDIHYIRPPHKSTQFVSEMWPMSSEIETFCTIFKSAVKFSFTIEHVSCLRSLINRRCSQKCLRKLKCSSGRLFAEFTFDFLECSTCFFLFFEFVTSFEVNSGWDINSAYISR